VKKKIAVVTGGAGFIGSHVVDLLLKKKMKVHVIDNFTGGHKSNLNHIKNNKNLTIHNLDICKINSKSKIFKNVDYVFHFAGIGDIVPSIEKPKKYMMVNVQGTVNILEASRNNKIKKFIYAASSSCYGISNFRTKEDSHIDPQYPYALSKNIGEQLVFHWHKVYNLPVNSIRIFNAYGPRVRTTGAYGAVFGVFFKQKLKRKPFTVVGSGNQLRDFVYVTDVAKAFYKAAITKFNGQIYNLGSDNPQTIKYLTKIIGGKTIRIPTRPGEPRTTWANISKIKKQLNWKPTINFEVGVKKMLNQINNWKNAPLWTPKSIRKATKVWFKHLKK